MVLTERRRGWDRSKKKTVECLQLSGCVPFAVVLKLIANTLIAYSSLIRASCQMENTQQWAAADGNVTLRKLKAFYLLYIFYKPAGKKVIDFTFKLLMFSHLPFFSINFSNANSIIKIR